MYLIVFLVGDGEEDEEGGEKIKFKRFRFVGDMYKKFRGVHSIVTFENYNGFF